MMSFAPYNYKLKMNEQNEFEYMHRVSCLEGKYDDCNILACGHNADIASKQNSSFRCHHRRSKARFPLPELTARVNGPS